MTMELTQCDDAKQLLEFVEDARRLAIGEVNQHTRGSLGQFMTPASVSRLMAQMFSRQGDELHLLDPGAGVGSLTAAFVMRQTERKHPPKAISVTAYEIDPILLKYLRKTLDLCDQLCRQFDINFTFDIKAQDFITACVDDSQPLLHGSSTRYDCIIMNPPYKKIPSDSATRYHLRQMGIEANNLYAAFMLLGAQRLTPHGEMVSITPRSFCNGPYFRPFRRMFFDLIELKEIHVFEARDKLFSEDDVLQENVIVHASSLKKQHPDQITISSTLSDGTLTRHKVKYEQVFYPHDLDLVVHISVDNQSQQTAKQILRFPCRLDDLGITASTGRVVDFRVKEYLRQRPSTGTVPLIYPIHFSKRLVRWPHESERKPNAIIDAPETRDQLVPSGYYVLLKRFSAKEEHRRIVASLFDPNLVPCALVGFENHLNYLHANGLPLKADVARGLCTFLNSTLVDDYFRQFSGHTQVNAADLRRLPFPTVEQLCILASHWRDLADVDEFDEAIRTLIHSA